MRCSSELGKEEGCEATGGQGVVRRNAKKSSRALCEEELVPETAFKACLGASGAAAGVVGPDELVLRFARSCMSRLAPCVGAAAPASTSVSAAVALAFAAGFSDATRAGRATFAGRLGKSSMAGPVVEEGAKDESGPSSSDSIISSCLSLVIAAICDTTLRSSLDAGVAE